jgi:hypothetical protein
MPYLYIEPVIDYKASSIRVAYVFIARSYAFYFKAKFTLTPKIRMS